MKKTIVITESQLKRIQEQEWSKPDDNNNLVAKAQKDLSIINKSFDSVSKVMFPFQAVMGNTIYIRACSRDNVIHAHRCIDAVRADPKNPFDMDEFDEWGDKILCGTNTLRINGISTMFRFKVLLTHFMLPW
jgi:hypothetical protein